MNRKMFKGKIQLNHEPKLVFIDEDSEILPDTDQAWLKKVSW